MTAPARARPAPTTAASTARGRRSSQMMTSHAGSASRPSTRDRTVVHTSPIGMCSEPNATELTTLTTVSASSARASGTGGSRRAGVMRPARDDGWHRARGRRAARGAQDRRAARPPRGSPECPDRRCRSTRIALSSGDLYARSARVQRNRQVFGLGIHPLRRLPGIAPSGSSPVRSPTPLRASPGVPPGSLASSGRGARGMRSVPPVTVAPSYDEAGPHPWGRDAGRGLVTGRSASRARC